MEEMKSLGLIYDIVQDEWVLDLISSFSSNKESTPSDNNNSSNASTPTSYESCYDSTPVSSLQSPLQLSLQSNGNDNFYSKGKRSSDRKGHSSSHKSCMIPYLVHMSMCHGHGKLWSTIKSSCVGCFKPNNKNKFKGVCSDINVSRVLIHKMKGSKDIREDDLKEAIHYCKRSAAS